ncbi:MAG TPA: Xaa-Pro peptidase family protein [Acidimicrobiales bacterium]|nr:Xaa-Pro peptidase family protein [Acidimicrobiales bacterium]
MYKERDWRVGRVRAAMERVQLDGLLAFAPGWRRENVRYLTGATLRGSFALTYLPASDDLNAFVINAADEAATLSIGWWADVRRVEPPEWDDVVAHLQKDGQLRRLGVAHLELMPKTLLSALREGLRSVEIVSATRLMDEVRLVKSSWELEQIRRAGVVCSAGWEALVGALRPGVAEFEIVAAVDGELKRLGAQDNFMLFASGGDEVMGMTPPGNRQLQVGDMVRTELTPQLDGYYAQICRSAVLGEPNEGQKLSFELFKEALEAGLSVVHAGVTAHEIAVAENDVFRKHGYGEYTTSQYTRVRGHGHGLHPDEIPSLLEGDETVLEENAVIIIHPNTYTPLAGYHVLGDPVVVKESGYELLLTTERVLFSAPA